MRLKQRRGNGDGDAHQIPGGGVADLVVKGGRGRGRGHCHQHGPSLAQFRMEVVAHCHRRRIYICWLRLVKCKMLNCIMSFNLMIMLWNWCGKKFVVSHDKLL